MTKGPERLVAPDVLRSIALIGVCVMNYHGYLILLGGDTSTDGFLERVLDPWYGPLATRFAAVFVTVAGIGVALLARGSRTISEVRWTLVRRGVLLYAVGYFFNWVWNGSILVYYGAFFLVGAAVCTLRSRWLATLGVASAVAAAAIQWWALQQTSNGHNPQWLLYGPGYDAHSPRDQLFATFVRGTHPLLPWLVFLCLGIVLGRMLPFTSRRRLALALSGAVLLGLGYTLENVLSVHPTLRSTDPGSRSLPYVAATIGSTLLAIVLIGSLAEHWATTPPVRALALSGRTTLTLYIGHALVFNLFVHVIGWPRPAGLGSSLIFAVGYWSVAIAAAVWWQRRVGIGPLEWVYRHFSDTPAANRTAA